MDQAIKNFILKTADDSFIIGHRNSEWTGLGPFMEEDIAFASMAQDKIGHALALYKLIENADPTTTAEYFAFKRSESEMLCCQFVEQYYNSYEYALVRHFLFDMADSIRYQQISEGSHTDLAHLAKKIKGELKYHNLHACNMMVNLGASATSNAKLQAALNESFALALSMFESFEGETTLINNKVYLGEKAVQQQWIESINNWCTKAQLQLPTTTAPYGLGGRQYKHSVALQPLLTEMREVINLDPNAEW